MLNIASILFSIVLCALAFLLRPQIGKCPGQWFVNGVRPSGSYTCLRKPVGFEIDCSGAKPCPEEDLPVGELTSKIYCTGGMHPIVVDAWTVGCQR